MKKVLLSLSALMLSFVLFTTSFAGVLALAEGEYTHELYINEVCSTNDGKNGNTTDGVDANGDYSDWIELYNPNNSAIELEGYGLSDGKKNLYKFTFSSGDIIDAKSFLLIFCSKDGTSNNHSVAPFGISASGEKIYLTSKNGEAVDMVNVPALRKDVTYSRIPDGSDDFGTTSPTPEESNNNAKIEYMPPVLSQNSGIYENEFDLSIENADSNESLSIYYTTDSSNPATSNTAIKYDGAIKIKDRNGEKNVVAAVSPYSYCPTAKSYATPTDSAIDKATVIRACVKDEKGNASESVAATYFVGQKAMEYGDINIVSISTDYDNLFDYDKGIYTKGKCYDEYVAAHPTETEYYGTKGNYSQKGREWERDCHVDLFETDGSCVVSQNCGLSIQGAVSRSSMQKSMRLVARSEYGDSKFRYPIFDNEYDENGELIKKYDSFIVRNGGNDGQRLKLSDAINQSFVEDTNISTQSAKPCYVFLNGEFWGTYALTTDYSAEYIEEKYGVDADNVIMYKNWKWEEGGTSYDKTLLTAFQNLGYGSMTDANYEKAKQIIDVDSFIDYMAAQIYYCNGDWPSGNFAFWRVIEPDGTEYGDGRWRFMLFDTDLSTGIWSATDKVASYDKLGSVISNTSNFLARVFNNLCTNKEFRNKFINRFVDLTNVNFNSKTTLKALENIYYGEGNLRKYLEKNWNSWTFSKISSSDKRYNEMVKFYSDRVEYALKYLSEDLLVDDYVKLSINLSDNGRVLINGLNVSKDEFGNCFEGKYVAKSTVTIEAVPNEGYELVSLCGGTKSVAEVYLNDDVSVEVVFEKKTLYGDCNNDEAVDVKDLLLLRKYISRWKVEIDIGKADANADGKVDIKDVLLLRKYLAHWDVVLGKQ